jgi:hypothetical protein
MQQAAEVQRRERLEFRDNVKQKSEDLANERGVPWYSNSFVIRNIVPWYSNIMILLIRNIIIIKRDIIKRDVR